MASALASALGEHQDVDAHNLAAVRGTEYSLGVDGAETTRHEVISGQVDVGARGTTREVEGGFATLAQVDESPMAPVPLLPAPTVELTVSHTGAVAVWPTQAEAKIVAGASKKRTMLVASITVFSQRGLLFPSW